MQLAKKINYGQLFWSYSRLGWDLQQRIFEDNYNKFPQPICPSCHWNNSFKTLKKTQSTDVKPAKITPWTSSFLDASTEATALLAL